MLSDTGMRPDECHRLDWSDITFANGRHGKLLIGSGKAPAARRELPLTPRVRALLERAGRMPEELGKDGFGRHRQNRTHRPFNTQEAARKSVTDSKVRPFLLYSLRHSFATRIAPHVDACTLCKIVGWLRSRLP